MSNTVNIDMRTSAIACAVDLVDPIVLAGAQPRQRRSPR